MIPPSRMRRRRNWRLMPVELLGVGVAPAIIAAPLGDAQIGLSQPYSVPAGEAIEPLDRGMQQLGVGRKT